MIYNFDNPDFSLYSLGAVLIDVIKSSNVSVHDTSVLYHEFRSALGNDLSFSVYLYTLDWLFILGLISIDEKGDILDVIKKS